MKDDIEKMFKEIEEFKKSKEFASLQRCLGIVELVDKIEEIIKQYNDIINPPPKIITSDRSDPVSYQDYTTYDGYGEFGYIGGEEINFHHEHIWVLEHIDTGGEYYKCYICGVWKKIEHRTTNISTASENDMEIIFEYADKTLGC